MAHFYRPQPDDAFPLPWENAYPARFGEEFVGVDGLRIRYTMHQSRDAEEGTRLS